MKWPLKLDDDLRYFTWSEKYAPPVMLGSDLNITDIDKILDQYQPTFPQRLSSFQIHEKAVPYLIRGWKVLMGIIIPSIWLIINFRILSVIKSSSGVSGLQLTLGFILLLGFTFGLVGFYGKYSQYQQRMDTLDQLDVLYHDRLAHDTDSTNEELLQLRDNEIYWNKFDLRWNLSNIVPSISIVDIFAIILAIFSQIYLLVWLLSLFVITVVPQDGSNLILLIDIIVILTYLIFIVLGIQFGLNQDYRLDFTTKGGRKFLQAHLLTLLISICLLAIILIIIGKISAIFLFPLLFAQVPLLTAFSIMKLRYLRKYLQIRTAFATQLDYFRFQLSVESTKISTYQLIVNADDRLANQPLLPAGRLRSYILILTAGLSLLLPIVTAFLSSIERFDEILRLVFPF